MRLLLLKTLLIASLATLLQGCETLDAFTQDRDRGDAKADEYVGWDDARFHKEAKAALDNKSYQKAITLYEALEARYPFGDYAAQAQLNLAYAYYKNDDPEAALAAAERFIKINPRNPHVDYAYYLKGLINYNRGIGFIDRFLPTDSTQRDPGPAREAFDNFQELIRRFPDSKYVPDARLRMVALRNNTAMHELHVADFYMRRNAYVAAINRASHILKEYPRTPAVPHALEIMKAAYRKLGMDDLATDVERIYALNYPQGAPIEFKDESIMQRAWDALGMDR
ncbi:MAG: outer membrane protein assembly factor BamD [Methylomonas sp.]|nr:outer membrane protein assembly factor BamD [Methylomonas sp.]PPD20973.1 MAG: outer membrane protein assembly factor BamD [Methylomonas sp.]PPD27218.1 MAG: outer membrane protein assembly factor BamD [Methylomonas sp.]PPD39168.1 MAG: outer membrane protein assembly factor BamD [Methylomonas sp.]PPD41327.1 MAG: outer membrane protein assembly factor BamD [Methylomonas sp.]